MVSLFCRLTYMEKKIATRFDDAKGFLVEGGLAVEDLTGFVTFAIILTVTKTCSRGNGHTATLVR